MDIRKVDYFVKFLAAKTHGASHYESGLDTTPAKKALERRFWHNEDIRRRVQETADWTDWKHWIGNKNQTKYNSSLTPRPGRTGLQFMTCSRGLQHRLPGPRAGARAFPWGTHSTLVV